MRIVQLQGLVGGGGSEVHTSILCRGLRERGHEVVLCAPDEPHWIADEVGRSGVATEFFPLPPTWWRLFDVRAGLWMARVARSLRADVIHTHLWNADVMGWFASKVTGIPVVATLHGPTISVAIRKNLLHHIHHRIYARMLLRFDAIIAISSFVRDFVSGDLRIPADRIDVVHNCSDVDLYRQGVDRSAVRACLGLPVEAPVVIIVGELSPRKGILEFVESAAQVHRQAPETHFLVVGSGVLEAQAREQASALGVAERVHFLGQRRDVPDLLRSSDILAVTSYKEGFGRTITEAMSSGLPVVSFDSGATAEIIVDGRTGLLVPEGDSSAMAERLIGLIRDRQLCRRMGAAGLQRAREKFDIGPFVDATERVLDRAVRARALKREA